MLKKSPFSPAQPRRAETRLFPLHRSRIVQTLNVPQGYASALHSLRPCWTAFLSILRESSPVVAQDRTIEIPFR